MSEKLDENISKEILENVIASIKTLMGKGYDLHVTSYSKTREGRNIISYTTSYSITGYIVDIDCCFTQRTKLFSRKKVYNIQFKISFRGENYRFESKDYLFDYGSSNKSLKEELRSILDNKYKNDLIEAEQQKDLDILKSLNESVDTKYKREGKIDDLLNLEDEK